MPVKKWWRSARISCTRDKSLTRQKRSRMRSFNLSALAVRERAITLFLIFAAACAGIYAYFHLGRGEDPSFTIKVLTVATVWRGATAQEMQDLVGEQQERIFVEFSYSRLTMLGISPADIFSALSRQNAVTPAGSVDTDGAQVFVRLDGAYTDIDKIRDTPIVAGKQSFKLSDIANVTRGYED